MLQPMKMFVKPEGHEYNCSFPCIDCFYLSAFVAPSGALSSQIGYGDNQPVKVHDGIAGVMLSAVREDTKKQDKVECNVKKCDTSHGIAGFNTQFVIEGAAPSNSTAVEEPTKFLI